MKKKFIKCLTSLALLFTFTGCSLGEGLNFPQFGQSSSSKEETKQPEFKMEDGILYVTYDGGLTWTSLGSVSGNDGQNGEDGKDGQNGQDGTDGKDGEDGEDGKDGLTPEFKVENGILYVTYDNGVTWIPLGNISGNDGQNGEDGKDGNDGEDGKDGEDGEDGRTPEFKIENGILYVTYDNGETWTPLGNISGSDEKEDEENPTPENPTPGEDEEEKNAEYKIQNGILYVTYDGGTTWIELGVVSDLDGTFDDVFSSYETFLKYYPDYEGTEQDWINDIIMGNYCNLIGHKWDNGEVTKEPKKGANGEKTYSCENCDEHKTEVIPMLEVADAEIYEVDGIQYVNYGSYPQTHVGDENLISSLNNLATVNERGYYEYNGDEYAKVESPTPCHYGTTSSTDKYGNVTYYTYTYSDGSTVTRYTTEWFNVEPIKWRVLSENEDGSYQIYSEYILNATSYCDWEYLRNINGEDIYRNNYKYSNIRAWLNGYDGTEYKITDYTNSGFIDAAFKEKEKAAIITKEVDNSVSTTHSTTDYVCENTYDKMYLLSYQDMLNTSYGFRSVESREAQVTDYAKAKGACYSYWSTTGEYLDNGYYWLRSPYHYDSDSAIYVNIDGTLCYSYNVYFPSHDYICDTPNGVRVACNINLK